MTEKGNVFVIQEVSKFNVIPAQEYGTLVPIFEEGKQIMLSPAPAIRKLKQVLKDFNDKDYLAASSYLNEIADASFKLAQFPVSIYKMLAFIALENMDHEAAIDYYELALSKSEIVQQEQNITLDLANILLTIGDFGRSLDLVQTVLDEATPRTTLHNRAEELFGRIEFAQSGG